MGIDIEQALVDVDGGEGGEIGYCELSVPSPRGGVLPYICYIGMCRPIG